MSIVVYVIMCMVVIPWISCSINITRSSRDQYTTNTSSVCLFGGWWASSTSCTCSYKKKTFFSKDSSTARCNDLRDLRCLKENIMSNNFNMQFDGNVCGSWNITTAYLWNLQSDNNGIWIKLHNFQKYFSINSKRRNKKVIQISAFKSRKNLKGHLIMLNISCGTCLAFKITGTASYPFNTAKHFPELLKSNAPQLPTSRTSPSPSSSKTPTPPLMSTSTPLTPARPSTLLQSTTARTIKTTKTMVVINSANLSPTAATKIPHKTSINVLPENNSGKSKQDEDEGLGVVVKVVLIVTSLIAVSLVIVVLFMCRRRTRMNDKEKEKPSIEHHVVYNNAMNGETCQSQTDENIYITPTIENIYLSAVDTVNNNQTTHQTASKIIGKNEQDIQKYGSQKSGKHYVEDNTYSNIYEGSYLDFSQCSLPRDESIMSNSSTVGLINMDYAGEERLYCVLEPEEVAEYNQVEETDRRIFADDPHLYAGISTCASDGQHYEGNYAAFDSNDGNTEGDYQILDTNARTSIYSELTDSEKNNSFQKYINVFSDMTHASTTDKESSASMDDEGVAYENSNYYHTLEAS